MRTTKNIYNKKLRNMTDFFYTIDPYAEVPIVLLTGEVGCMINGDQVARELYTLDSMGKTEIKIFINSVGGSVVDGMSIYDAITGTNARVDTYCVGVALSIAAVIFLAGDCRYILDYGSLMYHDPYNEDGSQDKGLERIRLSLIEMISKKNKKSKDEIALLMKRETWMDADEAVNTGFADEKVESTKDIRDMIVSEKSKLNKVKIINGLVNQLSDEKIKIKVINQFVNKFVEKNTGQSIKTMAKTKNKIEAAQVLDVKNSADDIEELQENVEELTEELDEAKQELQDAVEEIGEEFQFEDSAAPVEEIKDEADDVDYEAEMKAKDEMINSLTATVSNLSSELANVNNELKSIKEIQAKAELDIKNAKIEAMLNAAIKSGRIKDDAKENWKNLALNNYDATLTVISGLSVNKPAVKFGNSNVKPAESAPIVNRVDSKDFLANKLAEAANKRAKFVKGK